MTPQEQDAILTNIEPGSPMHATMSRYWLPACLSRDIPEPDSDPFKVRLLARDFVAFRDTDGRVGFLNEHCTHRSASLCLGRVEHGGIRCLYHGWKFDAEGNALDLPNVSDDRFKERIKQPAYPVKEAGGIIWVYLGPPELQPAFPHQEVFGVPETHRVVEVLVTSSNYTRALEGVVDSSHTGVLHQDSVSKVRKGEGPAPVLGGNTRASHGAQIGQDLAPVIETEETDYGFRYAALRRVTDENGQPSRTARITAFAMPAIVFTPPGNVMLFAAPIENDRTHFYMIFWDHNREIGVGAARDEVRAYYGIDDVGLNYWGLDRKTHDLPTSPNASNGYKQNREAMRRGESFAGLHRFIPEDFVVAESMGPIASRPREHLVPADLAVVRMRRTLVENAVRVRDGEEPVGLEPKQIAKAEGGVVTEERPWKSLGAEEA